MHDMKITDMEKREDVQPSALDKPSYPYGLKLHIDEECFKKLNLSEAPKVGAKMMILAHAFVSDVHVGEKGDDKSYPTFSLQIMEMAVKPKEKEEKKDAGQTLYGSEG